MGYRRGGFAAGAFQDNEVAKMNTRMLAARVDERMSWLIGWACTTWWRHGLDAAVDGLNLAICVPGYITDVSSFSMCRDWHSWLLGVAVEFDGENCLNSPTPPEFAAAAGTLHQPLAD